MGSGRTVAPCFRIGAQIQLASPRRAGLLRLGRTASRSPPLAATRPEPAEPAMAAPPDAVGRAVRTALRHPARRRQVTRSHLPDLGGARAARSATGPGARCCAAVGLAGKALRAAGAQAIRSSVASCLKQWRVGRGKSPAAPSPRMGEAPASIGQQFPPVFPRRSTTQPRTPSSSRVRMDS